MPSLRPALTALLLLLCPLSHAAASTPQTLSQRLQTLAPDADPSVIALATHAMRCAKPEGTPRTLSLIDYSRPSTEPRLWVFDLNDERLLFHEWVAHGKGSGENIARHFSNTPDSHMTSLGGFLTRETYQGGNGYSLRLDGLEPGFNDKARERLIVIHGAAYVNEALARAGARLGRSFGCPAVRRAVAKPLIDAIRGDGFVFAYYPDEDWLAGSRLLDDCGNGPAPLPRDVLARRSMHVADPVAAAP